MFLEGQNHPGLRIIGSQENWWRSLCNYLRILYLKPDEVTGWDFRLPPLGKECVSVFFGKKCEMDYLTTMDRLWHGVLGHYQTRFLFLLSTQLEYTVQSPLQLGFPARPSSCFQARSIKTASVWSLQCSPISWLNVDIKMALEARHWRWESLCQPGSSYEQLRAEPLTYSSKPTDQDPGLWEISVYFFEGV